MAIEPYRRLLALPGVRTLLLVGMIARIPSTATGITLTLHINNTLGLGWLEAGGAGAATTVGMAVGRRWPGGSSTGTACARCCS